MKELFQFTCLTCGLNFTKERKRIYKFCGLVCSNTYKGKIIHEQNKNKKNCIVCGDNKIFGDFSPINKSDISLGRRDICKHCSRNKKLKEIRSRTWKDDAKKIMLMNSKARSKKAGIYFDLTIDDIEIPEICPALGIELHTGDRKNWVNSPSIDRIDNTKGYTKDNIVIVSRRANVLKKDATILELKKLSEFYQIFTSD
jgi:hypothetical protein